MAAWFYTQSWWLSPLTPLRRMIMDSVDSGPDYIFLFLFWSVSRKIFPTACFI